MKKHNGMRPLDVVVLLKIIAYPNDSWKLINLATDLHISQSEISMSLSRSAFAGLIDTTKKKVFRRNLFDFLQYGLRYVFPQRVGELAVGMPTAHSAPLFSHQIISEEVYVWAAMDGTVKGQVIEPLYPTVPLACQKDSLLYDLLAITEVLRVGKTREVKVALQELDKIFFQ